MEPIRVTFSVTSEHGTTSFKGLDELQPEFQEDLISWAQLLIHTASQSLLAEHIGPEDADQLTFSITCKL
ncbi:hypothetical protein [Paenibacillus oryzisoli]|uniref:Uncharacterized protein n=1 Tax=Paenibacillus oryzisoli TaxID=1850517 RepID=A0A198AJZ7_9BACL|nr:hypothetical protein [Paenibacillus oryzisoli]OAS21400.1 hypothetical protein A8708_31535 [Paenibacillus oryzisoli]